MAVYRFTFPASAAGLDVSITDASGSEVDTATAGVAEFVQGPVVVTVDLPVGEYTAEATDARTYYTSRAVGVLDVPASLPVVAFDALQGAVEGAEGDNLQAILEDLVSRIAALEA